jgi:hypothetical protein
VVTALALLLESTELTTREAQEFVAIVEEEVIFKFTGARLVLEGGTLRTIAQEDKISIAKKVISLKNIRTPSSPKGTVKL